jgi:hypothetical protein
MEPFRIDGGFLHPRRYADWKWEEDTHMLWRDADPGDIAVIRFQSPEAIPDVDLELQLTRSGNYGNVTISINDSEELSFDGYKPQIDIETVEMTDIDIREGWNSIEIEITGKDPQSTGYFFGLDYLKVK